MTDTADTADTDAKRACESWGLEKELELTFRAAQDTRKLDSEVGRSMTLYHDPIVSSSFLLISYLSIDSMWLMWKPVETCGNLLLSFVFCGLSQETRRDGPVGSEAAEMISESPWEVKCHQRINTWNHVNMVMYWLYWMNTVGSRCINCFMFRIVSLIFLVINISALCDSILIAEWDDDSSHTLAARPAAGASLWEKQMHLSFDSPFVSCPFQNSLTNVS